MKVDSEKLIAYIHSIENEDKSKESMPKCDVCKKLSKFDSLYKYFNIEDGFAFEVIEEIHFCPVCGRALD